MVHLNAAAADVTAMGAENTPTFAPPGPVTVNVVGVMAFEEVRKKGAGGVVSVMSCSMVEPPTSVGPYPLPFVLGTAMVPVGP